MTAPLLVIDASTYRGTAAIVQNDRILGEAEVQMRGVDEERLMPAVASLLRETDVPVSALGGVVCGEGPGSFTSLRIAASIAKGIVTATGQPLLAVSSLLLMVAGASSGMAPGRYLALLDAMRGEWFGAKVTVNHAGVPVLEAEFEVMDASAIRQITRTEDRVAVGPAQTIEAAPHARGVARLIGETGVLRVVDRAGWEPSYGRLAEAQARWEQAHGRPLVV